MDDKSVSKKEIIAIAVFACFVLSLFPIRDALTELGRQQQERTWQVIKEKIRMDMMSP